MLALRNTLAKGDHAAKLAFQYLESLGYNVMLQKLKTIYAEVDGVLISPSGELVLCEIKSWHFADGGLSEPLSKKQLQRLQRAWQHLQFCAPKKKMVSLLVLVNTKTATPQFQLISDFL